jgi:hypothetical protein
MCDHLTFRFTRRKQPLELNKKTLNGWCASGLCTPSMGMINGVQVPCGRTNVQMIKLQIPSGDNY